MDISIFLPDELFLDADALANRLGVSRDELYAIAIAEFVARNGASDVTARLDRLYSVQPSTLAADLRRAQRRVFTRERW